MSILHSIRTLFAAVLLSTFSLSALAAPGEVEVISLSEREVAVVKNGKKVMERAPVNRAVPGDEIIYTTRFTNRTTKPASNIAINNPMPPSSVYVANSASGANTDITFSIDGGKSFAAADKLMVKTAEGKTRPALPAEYTHIRWAYKGALAVGKVGEVSFRATIK